MNEGMAVALWTKYLPAIRILLKKAMTEEQQMVLSKMELQSVDNRKNPNLSFHMEICKGKVENSMSLPGIGKDLFAVLNGDQATRKFMHDKTVTIQMTRSPQLTLKCH